MTYPENTFRYIPMQHKTGAFSAQLNMDFWLQQEQLYLSQMPQEV